MKLSIIIPAYNPGEYLNELLNRLAPQITEDVEAIVVDDGSEIPVKIEGIKATLVRQKNGGASAARNKGLELAKGDYIAFIDADDLVSGDYIARILEKIETEHFDYLYMSWRTMGNGWGCDVKLKSIEDKFPPFNLCVWNRVYKRSMIGKVRFNEKKAVAEDAEFIRKVNEKGMKKAFISDYMYYYRTTPHDSLTQRLQKGEVDINRVVYHIPHVTPEMRPLIDEFKALDKESEIILLTNKNEVPELADYAMILPPQPIRGTELRGEPTPYFTKIPRPLKTQVILYIARAQAIGGIETFMYNFCVNLSKYYDIMVVYSEYLAPAQVSRLRKIVPVQKNNGTVIFCDTVLNMRITEDIPANIKYKKKIQMCHTCRLEPRLRVPQNNDLQVFVSEVAAKSFEPEIREHEIINNMLAPRPKGFKRALRLISASRLSTWEKGADRMRSFAEKLRAAEIPFQWVIYSDVPIRNPVEGMIFASPTLDILPQIAASDYLVQLSDSESFCYSIVEALSAGVPVITTPLEVLDEVGFENEKHGYIVPFNLEGFDFKKLLEIPKVNYKYDNAKRIKQWRNVLGDTKPKGGYIPGKSIVRVRATREYFDLELNRAVRRREEFDVTEERGHDLEAKQLAQIIGG